MTLKVLALAVVLIVSSLAPAAAVIGFCAQMPCCFGEPHDGAALAANKADCCATISCYEAPPHEGTVAGKAASIAVTAPALLPVVAVPPAPDGPPGSFDDPSPPLTAKQRLTSLSILLI